jgi:serine/threonine protein kinase
VQVYAARWRGADAVVKVMQHIPRGGLTPAAAREERARAVAAFRAEAELQAGVHRLGACLTVEALAASFSNDDLTGPVDFAIVMPRMMPLPPLRSLTLAQRLQLVSDVANTVATLHALPASWGSLLHRDIKPGNILLNKPVEAGGCAHLGDFGESLLRAGVTLPAGAGADPTLRGPHGTPAYMDPALWDARAVPSKVRTSFVFISCFCLLRQSAGVDVPPSSVAFFALTL